MDFIVTLFLISSSYLTFTGTLALFALFFLLCVYDLVYRPIKHIHKKNKLKQPL